MPFDFKKLAVYSQLAYTFPAAVFVGALLGWIMDKYLGCAPVFLLLGFIAGLAGGFYNVFRVLNQEKER